MRIVLLSALVALAAVACGPGPEDRAETREMIADAVEASEDRAERLVVDAVAKSEARMRAETARTVEEAVAAAEARLLAEVEWIIEDAMVDYGWQPYEWGPWDYPAGGALGLEEIAALFGLFMELQEAAFAGAYPWGWDENGYAGPAANCWVEETCEDGVCKEEFFCEE